MSTRRRSAAAVQARRTLQALLAVEGAKVRAARRRRGWSQRQLAGRIGVTQPTISALERGDGSTMSLEAWQQVALLLGLPLKFELGRDALEEPADAGHLAIEELILRHGRATGRQRRFELATRPAEPSRSTDVGLIDSVHRSLILTECVNTFGNVNAAVRSSDRKRAEAEALAISLGGDQPYAVVICWVVRATRRNRGLLVRYPELFASRFPGSSRAWVASLTAGTRPPAEAGLVWCDVNATRFFEWRARVRA
jgi:transcriptional regulator with XRE-family HTH domain